MKRAIVATVTLAPAALAELKDWLGITLTSEDNALTTQLRAALETCEAFTGTMPIETSCEEVLGICSGWQRLETRPVLAITQAQAIAADGSRSALATSAYEIDVAADGTGLVRIIDPGATSRVAIQFTAGLASAWEQLPEGLRHGVVRLAAHHYRQRENGEKSAMPPAAVAALWHPWRRMRLL